MCLAYDSTKMPSAYTITLHKGLATGRAFVLQRLPHPCEYESALQELERLLTQLNLAANGAFVCGTTTTTTSTTINV